MCDFGVQKACFRGLCDSDIVRLAIARTLNIFWLIFEFYPCILQI